MNSQLGRLPGHIESLFLRQGSVGALADFYQAHTGCRLSLCLPEPCYIGPKDYLTQLLDSSFYNQPERADLVP